jgi:hypothetical protein
MHRGDRRDRRRIERVHHTMNSLQKIAHARQPRRGLQILQSPVEFAKIGPRAKSLTART